MQTAINYKVERDKELARRKTFGVKALPLPHPNDIIIDMNTGSVRIKGPMTKEDKVAWDQLRDLEVSIKKYKRNDRASRYTAERQRPDETEIQHSQRVLKMISAAVDD